MKRNVNFLQKNTSYVPPPAYAQPFEAPRQPQVPVLSDEEIRIWAEEKELAKGLPIDIGPFITQTLGLNAANPFGSQNAGSKRGFAAASSMGIKPPMSLNLDEYELSSESDIIDDSMNSFDDKPYPEMDEGHSDWPKNANMSSVEIKKGRKGRHGLKDSLQLQ